MFTPRVTRGVADEDCEGRATKGDDGSIVGSDAQERGRVAPAAVGWRCHAPGGPVAEELGTAIQRQLV